MPCAIRYVSQLAFHTAPGPDRVLFSLDVETIQCDPVGWLSARHLQPKGGPLQRSAGSWELGAKTAEKERKSSMNTRPREGEGRGPSESQQSLDLDLSLLITCPGTQKFRRAKRILARYL